MKKRNLPIVKILIVVGMTIVLTNAYAQTIDELETMGKNAKAESNSGGLSQDSEDKIKNFSPKNIPNFKMLHRNAVTAVGVSSDRNNPKIVIQDSLTGAEIDGCARLDGFGQVVQQGNNCTVKEIVNPSVALRNALVASSTPILGKLKVIKNGQEQEVDATFEVIVKAQYQGSSCDTTVVNGDAYQTCYTRPRR